MRERITRMRINSGFCVWIMSACISAILLYVAILPNSGKVHSPPVHAMAESVSLSLSKDGYYLKGGERVLPLFAFPYIALGPDLDSSLVPDDCEQLWATTDEADHCMQPGMENARAYLQYPAKLRQLGFDGISIAVLWNQFDRLGRGELTEPKALSNLRSLILESRRNGLVVRLIFNKSATDEGGLPEQWVRDNPNSLARNWGGDVLYNAGYKAHFPGTPFPPAPGEVMPVQTWIDPAYQRDSRAFQANLLDALFADPEIAPALVEVVTDTEPQYNADVDFSPQVLERYKQETGLIPDPNDMDPHSPWNKWRARTLAEVVYEDVRHISSHAPSSTAIVVMQLVSDKEVIRMGNYREYLQTLSSLDAHEMRISIIDTTLVAPFQEAIIRQLTPATAHDIFQEVNASRSRKWAEGVYLAWAGDDFRGQSHAEIIANLQSKSIVRGDVFNVRPTAEELNPLVVGRGTYQNGWSVIDKTWGFREGLRGLTFLTFPHNGRAFFIPTIQKAS